MSLFPGGPGVHRHLRGVLQRHGTLELHIPGLSYRPALSLARALPRCLCPCLCLGALQTPPPVCVRTGPSLHMYSRTRWSHQMAAFVSRVQAAQDALASAQSSAGVGVRLFACRAVRGGVGMATLLCCFDPSLRVYTASTVLYMPLSHSAGCMHAYAHTKPY